MVPDDRLDAGVLGERILAELASDAALLEAAERDIRVQGPERKGGKGGKISDQRARDRIDVRLTRIGSPKPKS